MTKEQMEKELKEMEEALEEPFVMGDSTDPPGTNSPSTNSPSTESPSTDVPETLAPSTDAPAEPDERDKTIEELRRKVEELSGPKTKSPSTQAPSTDAPISDEDFLGDLDFDDLVSDPKLFNQLLNKVYRKGREDTRTESRNSVESVLRSIPDIVKNNIAITAKLKEVNEKFYSENEDLVPFKKVVASVFEEYVANSPDKTYDELLPVVAEETRKRLELSQKALKPREPAPPTLPRKKGGPRQKPPGPGDTNPLLDEMAEMDKALGLD